MLSQPPRSHSHQLPWSLHAAVFTATVFLAVGTQNIVRSEHEQPASLADVGPAAQLARPHQEGAADSESAETVGETPPVSPTVNPQESSDLVQAQVVGTGSQWHRK